MAILYPSPSLVIEMKDRLFRRLTVFVFLRDAAVSAAVRRLVLTALLPIYVHGNATSLDRFDEPYWVV